MKTANIKPRLFCRIKKFKIMPMSYTTKYELFAFFDVLGYQNLVLHNEIQKTAEIIEKNLQKIPQLARLGFAGSDALSDPTYANGIKKCMGKPIVFSDSIVCDFCFDYSLKGGIEPQWLLFIGFCCYFQRLMFNVGLPVRGAISVGEYYIKENCFAGKPIVEAYDLCNRLDLVGCALTIQAEKELPNKDIGGIDALSGVLTTYETPLKGLKSQKLKLLNWSFPGGTWLEPFGNEIRYRIIEAFAAHGKPIPVEVYQKVNNTETFLNHCKEVQHNWNQKHPRPSR